MTVGYALTQTLPNPVEQVPPQSDRASWTGPELFSYKGVQGEEGDSKEKERVGSHVPSQHHLLKNMYAECAHTCEHTDTLTGSGWLFTPTMLTLIHSNVWV